jgi:hypothetical protein
MVEFGRITRIDVGPLARGDAATGVVTDRRVGIGATEAAVRRAYGVALIVRPHPYGEKGHYLEAPAPGRKRGLIFETRDGRVTSFRAGRYPSLDYIEACE